MPVKKSRSKTEEAIYQRLRTEKAITDEGATLIDIRITKTDGEKYLTVYCDVKGQGIGFDLLEKISLKLEPIVDAEFPEVDPDYFELSSPGAERSLSTEDEFLFYAGETVKIKFYAKEEGLPKEIEALLSGADGEMIAFVYKGQDYVFHGDKIASVKRTVG